MSHVLSCMACGTATASGPTVGGRKRPLCGLHDSAWRGGPLGAVASGEWKRASQQAATLGPDDRKASPEFARAFQDWLTRTRAEMKNHRPEAER